MIDILHANDVVFAQIGSRLHLNQIERHLSRVFEAMHAAQRDKHRFVFAEQNFLIVARHDRGSIDHDPMLRAMEMLLQ